MTRFTYGSELAHSDVSHDWRVLTFRASVQEEPERFIMRLEGRMVGPWVAECQRAWLALEPSLSTKKLALDLCGVTFVDESGLELLREMYRATQAEICTNSPLTKHFAELLTRTAEYGKGD